MQFSCYDLSTALHIRRGTELGHGSCEVVNGLLGHIVTSIITKSYNPGVLQSLLMVPLGVYVITKSGRPWLCILNGILAHVALIAGVNMVIRLGTNEAFTMTILMLAASLFLPLAISNRVASYNTLHKSK